MSSLAASPPVDAIDRLLDRIQVQGGIDFGGYDQGTLMRRLWAYAAAVGVATPAEMETWLLSDPSWPSRLIRLVLGLTSPAVALFGGAAAGPHAGPHAGMADAEAVGGTTEVALWRALREKVIPLLRTYPSINVWVPGCGAGSTAYAMAIVLHEEGLHERSRIYATDLAESVVERGRSGLLTEEMLAGAGAAYTASGGKASLATYIVQAHEHQILLPMLRGRITFAQHNLATDASFNEFQLILCRDVLADFAPTVAQRGYRLLHESLCRFGVVALGGRDRLPEDWRSRYENLEMAHQLYRRIA